MKAIIIMLLVATMVALTPAVGEACPGCGAALDATVGRGFNLSILFMMVMPFFVFGSVIVGIFFVSRSQRKKSTANSEQAKATN